MSATCASHQPLASTYMKIGLILIIGILQITVVFGQQYCIIYEKALEDFIQNEWGVHFLNSECTRLKFDPKIPIAINTRKSLTHVDKFQVSHYLDTSLLNTLEREDLSKEVFDKIYNSDTIFAGNCIKLSRYKLFIKTSKTEPSEKLKCPNYYMRMSALFFWRNYIYMSFWIKKSKNSSGVHIIYQFDNSFNIINKRIYSMCDELN